MINTLYSLDTLGTPAAFFIALLIGAGFGFSLERAGFSSSRRLAGVFYFTDMAVLKVMFTAVITAMLGLSYLVAFGWITLDRIYLMPTVYGAQIVGGLLFGAGFVMGGWCPGTAAAGVAAGRMDALVFLMGSIGGSILFNELYPVIGSLTTAGDKGVQMVYSTVGLSREMFALVFTLVAVAAFWMAEWAEKRRTGRSPYLGTPFLKAFSLAFVAVASGLLVINPVTTGASGAHASEETAAGVVEQVLMTGVDEARDHIEPEELADRMMAGGQGLVLVDVRSEAEYNAFHIRGAIHVALPALVEALQPHKNKGMIVLYSNGMTHPAQARDSLQRLGFGNVYLLTDGLQGFRDRCLKPISLRPEPLPPEVARRVDAWRAFFTAPPDAGRPDSRVAAPPLVGSDWLVSRLGMPEIKIIDLRPQPEYNSGHIPGSLSLNVESLRGNIGGVPSMLLPPAMLAAQFSLLGISPADTVVLVAGDKVHDATLAGMAFERLGHKKYTVLSGGYAKWIQDGRRIDTALPTVTPSHYPAQPDADGFTVDGVTVAAGLGKKGTVIIDVRPADFFAGRKSDEARAGHIPGAFNRPFSDDIMTSSNKVATFKPVEDLAAAYSRMIPSKDTEVIVHCRTGHQASQTFFVLKHLLGYTNVKWYDAGWTEWAARDEWPLATEANP